MFRIFSIIATVFTLVSAVQSHALLVPLYSRPDTIDWKPVHDSLEAHPKTTFYLIVNPQNGPGSTAFPDQVLITAFAKLNSYGNAKLLGYISTQYGNRAITDVEREVGVYSNWASYKGKNIALDGVFFNEGSDGGDTFKLAYYQQLSKAAKGSKLNTVIFNPGTKLVANIPKWFAAADFIVEYENTWGRWVSLPPIQHFSDIKYYHHVGMMVRGTPGDASLTDVVHLAVSMGLGAIYVTFDDKYDTILSMLSVVKDAMVVNSPLPRDIIPKGEVYRMR
ncbi:uncharacterized protein N7511_001274 [Penicillium nucicola]|uniref:uncharacterized protein n=1 Tax=Penicillium nucicola TaxID=1850975 RepID=UPI0025451579|nr:uncharacterized protein N7511_001274 [Penicillium nucicola]KAJ5776263.1 hypothetical protein N7511_001274 [Penicillium nucicola]